MAGFSLDMALYNRMTGNVGNIGSLETPQPQAASQEEEKRKKQVGLMALLKKLAPKLGLNNGGPVHFARGDAVEQEEMRDLGFKWNPEQQIYEEMVPGGYYTSMSRRNAPVIDEGWMLGDPGPAPTPELTGLQIGEAQRAASPSSNQLARGLQNTPAARSNIRLAGPATAPEVVGRNLPPSADLKFYNTHFPNRPLDEFKALLDAREAQKTAAWEAVARQNPNAPEAVGFNYPTKEETDAQLFASTPQNIPFDKRIETPSMQNFRELHSPEAQQRVAEVYDNLGYSLPQHRADDPVYDNLGYSLPQHRADDPDIRVGDPASQQKRVDAYQAQLPDISVGDLASQQARVDAFNTFNTPTAVSKPPTQQSAPTPVVPAEAAEAAPEKVATGKASLFSPEEMASWTQDQHADHKSMMSRNPEMVKKGFAWNPVPEFGHYEGSWQNPSLSKGVKGWADEVIGTTKNIAETVAGDIHGGLKGLSLPYNLVSGVIDALVSPATNTRDIYSPDYEQLTSPYADLDYANEIAVGQRGSPYGWTEGYDPDIQGPGAAYNSIEDYLKAVSLGAQTGDWSPPGEMSRNRREELDLPQEWELGGIAPETLADKGIGYGNWANLHMGDDDFDMNLSGTGTGTGPAPDLGPLGDFMDMGSWGDGDIDTGGIGNVGDPVSLDQYEESWGLGDDDDFGDYGDEEAMESFDSTSSGWSQGGGLASLESPERYGFGGNILSTLGRIGGTMFLTPFLGPIGASAASSGAVSMLEGKGLKESATDAAISGLMSFGTGKLFGTDMMSDVGQTPVSDVATDFGMSINPDTQSYLDKWGRVVPSNKDLASAARSPEYLSGWGLADETEAFQQLPEVLNTEATTSQSFLDRGIGTSGGQPLYEASKNMVREVSDPITEDQLKEMSTVYEPMRMRDIYRVGAEEVGRQAFYPEFEEEEIEEREEYIMPRRQRARPRPRRTTGRTFYDWKLGGAIDKYATGGGAKRGGIGQLTPGDFVISADVVSNVGDGSSEFGANRIEEEFGINDMENSYNRAGVVNTGLSGMVRGPGSGLDDLIQTTIAGKRAARLANQEVVVPKNVVRSIGGGDITQGQEKLYNFMDNVRKQKHGTSQQPTALKGSLSSLMG